MIASLLGRLVAGIVLIWVAIYSISHLAAVLRQYWWAVLVLVLLVVGGRAVLRPRYDRHGW